MGGGVGLSVHADYRISSEATIFAMPETGIGLFPDVGGSYFLSRCPGAIGMYLALTGSRLKAADCLYAGISDHYIEAAHHDTIVTRMRDGDAIDEVLNDLASDPGPAELVGLRGMIDRTFSGTNVETVLTALQAEGGEWAGKVLKDLAKKSPTSLKIACQQLQKGAGRDFDSCMVMEYRMSQHIMGEHDFFEGVRALIVDKDSAPVWQPNSLGAVNDVAVERYFASPDEGDLTFEALKG